MSALAPRGHSARSIAGSRGVIGVLCTSLIKTGPGSSGGPQLPLHQVQAPSKIIMVAGAMCQVAGAMCQEPRPWPSHCHVDRYIECAPDE